ncbi:MAG: hypothetical protein COX62_04940 [Deltaproteobacteria bacterium CG_4_10_14_0_2_um_filter_43_8]|nr:MAG: hypothetical protein COV43_05440 [Deltaproteobacteria bacterium CG11_big_fil_rev_8_21_14_0_20_42_23]PJA20254.1 MAG: hypothetical protein COX62_04940 [Deltaproteobacteria bacterium CG_4_10_14_0_2_um_filter_43_8]PJC64036.1 MAG: hypothetical protein CO021_06415 [Deltaproteobacteria bacterium CG_4_9_14_0_2_um_filter_42_21]
MQTAEPSKSTQIIDPTPPRRKHLIDVLYALMDDKVSYAEMTGVKKRELINLAEVGFVKLSHGRLEEAEKIFRGLSVLDHRNAYFHAMLGSIHQRLERPVEAILEYSQALELNPHDISALVNRGEIYLRHKNYRKAAEDFKSAILHDMSGANLWANRARSLVIAIKCSLEADKESVLKRARKSRSGK